MKKTIIALVLFVLCSIGIYADGATPSKIVGLVGACDTTNTGCTNPVLASTSLLCNSNANCPESLNPDLSNPLILYGVNVNCVKSINGGTTWGTCASNQPLSGGTIGHVAATSNGTVIGTATTGTNCVISRSINGTTSWVTVYDAAPTCPVDAKASSLRCAGIVCVVGSLNAAAKTGILASSDDGQNWSIVFTETVASGGIPGMMFWDGTVGILQTNLRTSDSLLFTSSGVGGWARTANALGLNFCYGVTNSPTFGLVVICRNTLTTLRLVNVSNGTITGLTVPNVSDDGFPKITTLGGNHYIGDTTGNSTCTEWATAGGGTSYVQLGCSTLLNKSGGEMFAANGKIYDTAGFNGVNATLASIQ